MEGIHSILVLHFRLLRFTFRDLASSQSKFFIIVGLFHTAPFYCGWLMPRETLEWMAIFLLIFGTACSREGFQTVINLTFYRPIKVLPLLLLQLPLQCISAPQNLHGKSGKFLSRRNKQDRHLLFSPNYYNAVWHQLTNRVWKGNENLVKVTDWIVVKFTQTREDPMNFPLGYKYHAIKAGSVPTRAP